MPASKLRLLSGNEACALAAIHAGARFFAGYPITPSSEIAENLARMLPREGGTFIQMEDEIAAMGAIIGASLAGLKSLTATSGPGFSLKQENLGYACMTEVPCVIVNVMRGGPSTGMPTLPSQSDVMQAKWGTHGDHPIIALAPASVGETYFQTIQAFNMSEKYRIPVIVLLDEIIGHMRERIEIPDLEDLDIFDRVTPDIPPEDFLPYKLSETGLNPLPAFGDGYRFHVTGLCYDETGFPTNDPEEIAAVQKRLNGKLTRYASEIEQVEEGIDKGARIGVFAYGSSSRSAKHAATMMRDKGIPVGFLRAITLWPFPEERVRQLAEKVDVIIVPELNLGQMKLMVESSGRGLAEVVPINRVDGEPLPPAFILDVMNRYC